MGDVVNKAAKLCNMANKEYGYPILLTDTIYNCISTHNQSVLHHVLENTYGGNLVTILMDQAYEKLLNE